MPERSSQIRALDGVRGIAIGCVMALHFAGTYFPGGAIGVDAFFALSAYLITTLLLNEQKTTGRVQFRDFYARRALRLGPALVLWLALLAAPTSLVIGQGDLVLGSTIASLFYFGNYALVWGFPQVGDAYAHVWSLAIEEQFYLVWPALLIFVLGRLRKRLLAAFMGAGWLVAIAASFPTDSSYFLPWGHTIPLVGGAAVAAAGSGGMAHRLERVATWWPLAAASCLVIAAVTLAGDDHLYLMGGGVAAVLLVAHAAAPSPSPVKALLEWGPLVWLGRRSYGLYLYHRTLTILLPEVIHGLTLKTGVPLYIVLSCVLAELSWRLVESPIMRWGRARLDRRGRSVIEVGLSEASPS